MKYRYLVVCVYGDEPQGTNDFESVKAFMTIDEYYVIDAETGEQLYYDANEMQITAAIKEIGS